MTFGASDAPLKAEDLEKNGLVQWPKVMGGIVPVVNLDGVKPGELTSTARRWPRSTSAKIKTWNDPALVKLNPGVKLPERRDRRRASFRRFGHHLHLHRLPVQGVGGLEVQGRRRHRGEWPVGLGAKGNEGVANTVANTKGSIGYVEYAYAKQNKMTYADMVNHDGKTVAPTRGLPGRRRQRRLGQCAGLYQILTDQPGAESWPITAATFILIHKQPQDAAVAGEALKFFDWAFKNGAEEAAALDYIPMPDNVVGMVRKTWAADVKTADGKPVYQFK